ncbi:hypothetical protein CBS101457_004592 [Exobasidium rhododendri]|nr:hypothetical protein CBS101457_004592 [Exobasidium rhododendri]
MFSSLLSAPCELKLHLLHNAIFLRPPTSIPSEESPPTSNDEVARGMVELYVPNDRKIGGIRVKLRAVQSVAILPDQKDVISFAGTAPLSWEDTVLMEKVVEIGFAVSKSHVTVPGDDVIHSGERRGRSRVTRSRNATPETSRAASPNPVEPPGYEEEESNDASRGQTGHIGGIGAAFARAISRGRQGGTSGPNSRSNSRPVSRSASRNASPTRENSGPPTARASPRLEVSLPESSPSSSPGPSRLPSANDIHRVDTVSSQATPDEQLDTISLATSFSRTGLHSDDPSAGGPHPLDGDRNDQYGLVPPSSGFLSRGRGGSSKNNHLSAGSRSSTMSPSRTFGRRGRDESKSRLVSIGKKGARTPSVDTGSAAFRSSTSTSNQEEQGGLELQKGVHGFEFAFIIPSDSPPYERSPYGRVRYVIKATAFGAGRAKSNLEAWRDLFPVVNPSPEGGPTPLTILYNDMHPTVGLLSVACTSNNISVGGIFNVDIHSPTPPTDLIVYLVRVSVETTVELQTKRKGKQIVPPQRFKIFEKGWVPPRPNDPQGNGDGKKAEGLIRDPTKPGSRNDDAWTVQGVARMPNDNVVRSSTIPRTKASIRFTHQLLVEVVHSREATVQEQSRKLKVFALRQPITLPSCCVAYDAVTLPAYTPDDQGARPSAMPYDIVLDERGQDIRHATIGEERGSSQSRSTTRSRATNTATPANGLGHEFCVCGQSIQDLSERDRNLMPVMPNAELPLDGLSHRKIGEIRSRGSDTSLNRSTSRSSSTSNNGTRRSISRSLSRGIRPGGGGGSSSSATRRPPSVQRPNYFGGGERGEGVIRTMSRGSRSNEVPGEAQGHFMNGITNPPLYGDLEEEGESKGQESADETGSSLSGALAERGRASTRE